MNPFIRCPPPIPNQPPLRITTKDVGRQLGLPDGPENLEIIAANIPPELSLDHDNEEVGRILMESKLNLPEPQ